jgi:ribosomal protein L12E/L44/L45/RPP1/RPP2
MTLTPKRSSHHSPRSNKLSGSSNRCLQHRKKKKRSREEEEEEEEEQEEENKTKFIFYQKR